MGGSQFLMIETQQRGIADVPLLVSGVLIYYFEIAMLLDYYQ